MARVMQGICKDRARLLRSSPRYAALVRRAEPPTPDTGVGTDDNPISDEELTALALAADPQAPPDEDAVPIGDYLAQFPGLLPEWYMPIGTAHGRGGRGGRLFTSVIVGLVAAFLVIEAFGLCSTYGQWMSH